MKAPDRLSVPTCIGCGAMSRFGTCASGCSEHKLELVRAAAHDSLTALGPPTCASIDLLLPLAEELVTPQPQGVGAKAAYASLRGRARDALRATARLERPHLDVREPADPAIAWWCAECEGLDAPQPCLGICVWRPVEWVDQALYQRERERLLPLLESEHRLRGLVRRLAWVDPRPGRWEDSWRVFATEAEPLVDHVRAARRRASGSQVQPQPSAAKPRVAR